MPLPKKEIASKDATETPISKALNQATTEEIMEAALDLARDQVEIDKITNPLVRDRMIELALSKPNTPNNDSGLTGGIPSPDRQLDLIKIGIVNILGKDGYSGLKKYLDSRQTVFEATPKGTNI